MRYPAYPTVYPEQRPPRRFTRRSLLRLAVAGPPLAVGAALTLKGGLLVWDLRERERNVGKLASNTGRALEVHGLTAAPAPAATVAVSEAVAPDLTNLVAIPLPPPPDDAVADGSVGGRQIIGRVRMDSIKVDAPLVQVGLMKKGDGYVWQTADRAVGFHENSALPGSPSGNSVFSGHISSIKEGDVFRHLPEIAIGDTIRLTLDRTFTYRVADKLVVSPSDSWVMNQTAAPIATFITCVPDGVYSHRLIVMADLVKG